MALTLSQLPQSASVAAYWLLDELSGNRVSQTGNNELVDHNTVGFATGHDEVRTAANFIAANSEWLEVPDASQTGLDLTGAFTICTWLRPVTLLSGNNMSVISKGHESNAHCNFYCWVTDSGGGAYNPFFRVSDDGSTLKGVTGSSVLANDTPVHLTFIYIPSTSITIYVNSVQDGQNTTSIPAALYNSAEAFQISATAGANNYWNNRQDTVIVWNVALSQTEINRVYTETFPGATGLTGKIWG